MPPRSTSRGSHGAWQRFERGEMSLFPFYEQFGRELSDTQTNNPAYVQYCKRKGIGQQSPRAGHPPAPRYAPCGVHNVC